MAERIDPGLLQFATGRQLAYALAINEHGTQRRAAKALGINNGTIGHAMTALRRKAEKRGWSPAHDQIHPCPETQFIKGVSTLYDARGNVSAQWVKTQAHQQRAYEAVLAAAQELRDTVGREAPVPFDRPTAADLCTVYTLTDSHVGMLAWDKEAGADWDLNIAEQTLLGCFAHMVDASPNADTAFVNQLGDFLHYDSLTAVTPTAGNVLDADGRYGKMVKVAIRILRAVIALALKKHRRVILLTAEGNHDMASSVWLRAMFSALYEDEPRVQVIDSELPYYVHQHGATMLGFHHGHLTKNERLPILFAAQFPAIWGETKKRYIHVGHWHFTDEKGHPGVTVIQHPTLAARDAYAARNGYLAEREATAITYSAQWGQVARNTVTPEMLA